jgi:hypothetical protein
LLKPPAVHRGIETGEVALVQPMVEQSFARRLLQ